MTIQEAVDPEFHTALNIASRRVYGRGLEYRKLMDARLVENSIAQNNLASFRKYLEFVPAYEDRKSEFQTSSQQNLKKKLRSLSKPIKKPERE